MTKSELIERLASQQSHIPAKAVEDAVKEMLEHMASTLAQGERIEIRGFGSFSLHYRAPRTGRNPKTGDKVELEGKYVPHFKPERTTRPRQYLRRVSFTVSGKDLLNKKAPPVLFYARFPCPLAKFLLSDSKHQPFPDSVTQTQSFTHDHGAGLSDTPR